MHDAWDRMRPELHGALLYNRKLCSAGNRANHKLIP
jgi:hypothetical protein